MLEELAGLKSGIEPHSCGWIVGEVIYKTLQGLVDPSCKVPLIITKVVGGSTCKYLLGLLLKVPANKSSCKILPSNFKQSYCLLCWFENVNILINLYPGNQQIEVVAQHCVNIAIPRPELPIVGR